ncbi:MAG: hypothetical protein EXR79_17105, partial [Myxococcales bacterium]|nr:hypothetical protein [Myxococcales bacterium]
MSVSTTSSTLLASVAHLLRATVVACAVGCTEQPPAAAQDSLADQIELDTEPGGDAPAEAGPETASGADSGLDTAVPETVADCPGGPGCSCTANAECQTGLCIDDNAVAGGKACVRTCKGSCPGGYACANVPGSGGDVLSICVPKFGHLCEPCGVSKDCEALGLKDSACVDQGGLGRFCGISCGTDVDCPAEYACSEVATAEGGKLKQCVRKPDAMQSPFGVCSCSAVAVAKKLATACFVEFKDGAGNPIGKCAGQRSCTAAGLSVCVAPEAKAEVCNGVDDDCDGKVDEAACDDGKACTKDSCAGKDGCKHEDLGGEPCDADGSLCTENDSCVAGACAPGAKKGCDDKNLCTQDACEPAKGCTQVVDDGKPCDADGTACTTGDVCQGGACQKGALAVCDDGNPCTVDKCDPKSGQCVTSAEDDGIPCDDGTKCTSKDACLGGVCKGKAVACEDSNPCTDDVCDKVKGCTPQALTGAPCSDDNPCTIGDSCATGNCKSGPPKLCTAPNTCVVATCDLTADGKCVFKNAKGGTPCDDGSACTEKDTCLDGSCDGVVLDCNDQNACTYDGCDTKAGCTSSASSSPCSDGSPCTILDKCAQGKCTGAPLDPKIDCNDNDPCTTDSCDVKSGCVHPPNQLGCDDGNPCTQGDQCGTGKCQAGSNTCGCQGDSDCAKKDDSDLCNGVLYCDKAVAGQFACKIKPGSVIVCDAALNTACSQQVCGSATGNCAAQAQPDGKGCDADGSLCTGNDQCAAGACKAGAGLDCDDKNPCTNDSCSAKTGCANAATTAACDADGNACTVGDACQTKVCLAGSKKPCDDNEVCSADTCDAQSGNCGFDGAAQGGKGCDDGSLCTEADTCAAGKCAPGKAKVCNDANPCTDDACDPKVGCVYGANTSPCDDGNACTKADLCGGSTCSGKPVNVQTDCSDGLVCTTDGCSPTTGCSHLANQLGCDDGNPCTQGDLCSNKACGSGSNVCGCENDAGCAAQEDGDLCNGTLFCDTAKVPYTCKVKQASVVACDSGKDTACVASQCDAKTGKCAPVPASDGKGCDADGSVCTTDDKCAAGLCKAGANVDCDDKNACTTDSCDPKTGCAHVANTAVCDADGDACTVADTCKDKTCLPGAKKPCDDDQACTVDACDKASGKCVFDGAPLQGKACDADASVCTVNDTCAVGKCVPGAPKACTDSNPCT